MVLDENSNFNSSGHFSFIVYFIMNGLYSVKLQQKIPPEILQCLI